jgi:hypothetical protein
MAQTDEHGDETRMLHEKNVRNHKGLLMNDAQQQHQERATPGIINATSQRSRPANHIIQGVISS